MIGIGKAVNLPIEHGFRSGSSTSEQIVPCVLLNFDDPLGTETLTKKKNNEDLITVKKIKTNMAYIP